MSEHFFSFLESISQRRRITGTEREENIQRVKKNIRRKKRNVLKKVKKCSIFGGKNNGKGKEGKYLDMKNNWFLEEVSRRKKNSN